MTTIMTTTRLWGSDDSSESINHRFRDLELGRQTTYSKSRKEIEFSQKALNDHQSKKMIQRKSGKTLSRTSILAVPKRQLNNDQISGLELNGVKKSALLYEITDRTNRLAKPKTIVNDFGKIKNPSSRISLPKFVSQRVSELSRPKIFYNPPAKPFGYVAPCALRAVATRRILELSTPRKTRSSPRSVKKNVYRVINAPCSSRISYLARPKHSANCSSGGTRRNFLKRSSMPAGSEQTNPTPWKFPNTRVWRKLGYSKNVVKRCEKEYSRRTRRKHERLIKPSRSNDSVLSLSVKKSRKFRKHKTKKFRFRNKM